MEKKKDPIITLMRSVAIILVVLQHALNILRIRRCFLLLKFAMQLMLMFSSSYPDIYLKERKVIIWVKMYPDLLSRKQKSF